MAFTYTTRDGKRVQTNVAAAFDRLNAAFRARFGLNLLVSSGTRTTAEQRQIFLERYRPQASGNGPYGDVRVYQGVRYVRVSSAGTVAVPGTSNHEENGPIGPRALDIRDSGNNAGVTSANNVRSNWIRANASAYGFNPAGYGFGEPWHIEYTGSLSGSPSGGGGSTGDQVTRDRQGWLNLARGEKLTVDGQYGPATQAAYKRYQEFLRSYGYTGNIDGEWGAGTQSAHEKYYDAFYGNGTLVVDGEMGPSTIRRLQRVLGVVADGQLGAQTYTALQTRLIGMGQSLVVDGDLGPATIKALQTVLMGAGAADGAWGPATTKALQTYLNNGGTFPPATTTPPPASDKLTVDGDLGPATIKALQKSLGVSADGDWGPATTSALQKAVGATVDGQLGPKTIKGLQLNVGVTADGEIGPQTIKALQTFLNEGKGWKVVEIPDDVKPPETPVTERKPTYPKATVAYNTPNGGVLNDKGEKIAGRSPSSASIQYLYVHHTAGTQDDTAYFKTLNSRKSCPTWYVKATGSVTEFITPKDRPWSTGAIDNYSLTIETQNTTGAAGNWGISNESHEAIAQIAAWMSQQEYIDGVKVDFKIDRDHIKGHKEAPGAATACPGPSMRLDWIVARAKEIVATTTPTEPEVPNKIPASLVASWEAFKAEMDKFLNSLK